MKNSKIERILRFELKKYFHIIYYILFGITAIFLSFSITLLFFLIILNGFGNIMLIMIFSYIISILFKIFYDLGNQVFGLIEVKEIMNTSKLNKNTYKKVEKLNHFIKKIDENIIIKIVLDDSINGHISSGDYHTIYINHGSIENLNLNSLKSIVLHEYGHLNHNHGSLKQFILFHVISKYLLPKFIRNIYSRYRELQADNFAINTGGKKLHKNKYNQFEKYFKTGYFVRKNEKKFILSTLSFISSSHPSDKTRKQLNGKITLKHYLTLFL